MNTKTLSHFLFHKMFIEVLADLTRIAQLDSLIA